MLGDESEEYELHLADGTIGMIDGQGRFFLGAKFLMDYQDEEDVLVGVLAHEMGHRPKRWGDYMEEPQSLGKSLKPCVGTKKLEQISFAPKL